MISPLIILRALYGVAALVAITAAGLVCMWSATYNDLYKKMNAISRDQGRNDLHGWKRPWEANFTYFMVFLSVIVAIAINVPSVTRRWIYTVPAVVANAVVGGLWFFNFTFIWGHAGSGGMLDPNFLGREYSDTFTDPDLFQITDHSKEAVSAAKALFAFTLISAFMWGCAAMIMHMGRRKCWKNAQFTFSGAQSYAKTPLPMRKIRNVFQSEKTNDDTIEIHIPAPTDDDAGLDQDAFREAKRAIYAKALYDYIAKESTEISFKAGDMVRVITYTDDPNSWWEGEMNGLIGEFPGNYVKMLTGSKRKLKATAQ